MQYRNIDEDIKLFKAAERYWSEDSLTTEQLYWILGNEGYSEKEVDNAIGDYYYIHIRPERTINYLYTILIVLISLVIFYKIIK